MDEKFEELYNITVKPNFKELSFFWSYPYSDEFVQTILKENADEVELDNVKNFILKKTVNLLFTVISMIGENRTFKIRGFNTEGYTPTFMQQQ